MAYSGGYFILIILFNQLLTTFIPYSIQQICASRDNLFCRTCIRSSKRLHDNMFAAILHAPMRFFDSNSSGRILNRVSTDMGLIDEHFLPTLMVAFDYMSDVSGILLVIIIVNPPIVVPLAVAVLLIGLIFKLYVRTSQDLKRLEGICEYVNSFFAHKIFSVHCFLNRPEPSFFSPNCNNEWPNNNPVS